jgi:hypothetical protein
MKSGVVSARYDLKILFVIMLHVLDRLDFASRNMIILIGD